MRQLNSVVSGQKFITFFVSNMKESLANNASARAKTRYSIALHCISRKNQTCFPSCGKVTRRSAEVARRSHGEKNKEKK